MLSMISYINYDIIPYIYDCFDMFGYGDALLLLSLFLTLNYWLKTIENTHKLLFSYKNNIHNGFCAKYSQNS